MIDIHSHILPGIDDGATSVEESIQMLRQAKQNNIEVVVATPHFHPKYEQEVDLFLKRRQESYELLKKAVSKTGEHLPKIKLGCELNISEDISGFDLEKFCIEGSNYILVEMPYMAWTDEIIDRLYHITYKNLKPIMAHIERFYVHEKHFDIFLELDALCQINANSVIDQKGSTILDALFKKGMVQFLASDSHNTTSRKNSLLGAYKIIDKKYGKECGDYLAENAYRILENKEVEKFSFKKKNFLTRII